MKKSILLLSIIYLLGGCETGTRYDKNSTQASSIKVPKNESLTEDIESLIDEEDISPTILPEDEVFVADEVEVYDGGTLGNGFDIKNIRKGRHNGYLRLVFDVYEEANPAYSVGRYRGTYNVYTNKISITLEGYRKFSAALPSFSSNENIEKIFVEKSLEEQGFNVYIKLLDEAKVKIFDLSNPARLVIDIKAI